MDSQANSDVMQQKIFLIGGTGRTGVQVAEGALEAGHFVTAVVRRAPKAAGVLELTNPIQGDGSSKDLYSDKEGVSSEVKPIQTF